MQIFEMVVDVVTQLEVLSRELKEVVDSTFGSGASVYVASALLATLIAFVVLWRRSCTVRTQQRDRAAATGEQATKKKKAPRAGQLRMCRFCEVEIPTKSFMETHIAGKKHKKLAGSRRPDDCWVWVPRPESDSASKEAAPIAAPMKEDDGWVIVDAAAKKREARAVAAKRKAEAKLTEAQPEPKPSSMEVPRPRHRFCNGCKARAVDGAVIETDPDDETKAYCSVCWERWYATPEPEPAAQEAEQPARIITKWNRDD